MLMSKCGENIIKVFQIFEEKKSNTFETCKIKFGNEQLLALALIIVFSPKTFKSLTVTCSISVVFSTNKTDRHDITEILLKVALNTITSQ